MLGGGRGGTKAPKGVLAPVLLVSRNPRPCLPAPRAPHLPTKKKSLCDSRSAAHAGGPRLHM